VQTSHDGWDIGLCKPAAEPHAPRNIRDAGEDGTAWEGFKGESENFSFRAHPSIDYPTMMRLHLIDIERIAMSLRQQAPLSCLTSTLPVPLTTRCHQAAASDLAKSQGAGGSITLDGQSGGPYLLN